MAGALSNTETHNEMKVQECTQDIEKWCKHDQEAHAQIMLAQEDSMLTDIVETKTAHNVWTWVIECWEGKGM
jgi:hypothetical protein